MPDSYPTLNPSDKSASITLSDGNLTAQSGATYCGVRATQGKSAGKFYFEMVKVTAIQCLLGIAESAASLASYAGSSQYSYGYDSETGKVYFYSNGGTSYGSSIGVGDILGIAIDLDNHKLWFSKNGVYPNSGDPAAGTNPYTSSLSGTFFPFVSGASGAKVTCNFGETALSYSPPSGFQSGFYIIDPYAYKIPLSSLILTAENVSTLPVFVSLLSMILNKQNPVAGARCQLSNLIGPVLSSLAPTPALIFHPEVEALLLSAKDPAYVWEIPVSALPVAQIIYTCTLTGNSETPTLADLVLPMSSFQATMRDGDPSYLSCVIPNSPDYADGIVARTHGDIVVKKGCRLTDGTESLEEIARVDYESLQIDRGARNDSATISGHKTVTSSSPKAWEITGLSYYGLQAEGSRRIRGDVDTFLRCGDTVIFDLEGAWQSFIVGNISYNVSPNQAYMDVTEAWETVPEVVTPPEVETSQEYELVGPGVIHWGRTGYFYLQTWGTYLYVAGAYQSDDSADVMLISLYNWSVQPVDPTKPSVNTGARGVESPVFAHSSENYGLNYIGFGDPGNGCMFTVAADYTVDGVTRTAYKSVVLSP